MSKKNHSRRPARPAVREPNDPLDALPDLWAAIDEADPLRSEIETATALAIPRVAGNMTGAEADKFIADNLVLAARDRGTPEAAAFLRLMMTLGAPIVKRAASSALGTLTTAGVYPLEWVTDAGKPEPRRAWRLYDQLGDHEWVAVSFGYGDSEHMLLAQVERAVLPVVFNLSITTDPDDTIKTIQGAAESHERFEQIGLGEARRRLEDALKAGPEDDDSTAMLRIFWPVAMSRMRRLPEDALASAGTETDRAAAVAEFLASSQASGPDTGAARFWAEVLTGYTARIPGEPPTMIGPHMLPVILLGNVPAYFTLTTEQRAAMEPAVTGWLAWSIERRGIDEAAGQRLTAGLKEMFASFDEAYEDPDNALSRRYLDGVATPMAGPLELAAIRLRRLFAVPDQPPRDGDFDPASQRSRHDDAREEFGTCEPPAGMTSDDFVAAVGTVLDEIWAGEPASVWDRARALVDAGASRHDTLHTLAARAG